jgi:hypothetical protein
LGAKCIAQSTAGNSYRAHNASVVAAYLEHREVASTENEVERFFLNLVLLRVLYAHALASAPRLSLGRLAPLGRVLGDPRLGMAGIFLSLGRVLPARYPADRRLEAYLEMERGRGRLLDYGVIAPCPHLLYEWAARELDQPACWISSATAPRCTRGRSRSAGCGDGRVRRRPLRRLTSPR